MSLFDIPEDIIEKFPFGPGKMNDVARLVMHGLNNVQIENYVIEKDLNTRWKRPLTKSLMGEVRSRLKREELLADNGFPSKEMIQTVKNYHKAEHPEDYPDPTEEEPEDDLAFLSEPHPEWDMLSIDQIGEIEPLRRKQILDYLTLKRQREALENPVEYATRAQIDEQINNIQDVLNGRFTVFEGKMDEKVTSILDTINNLANNPMVTANALPPEPTLIQELPPPQPRQSLDIDLNSMNREQIMQLMLDNPDQFQAPQEAGTQNVLVESSQTMIRRLIVEVTPYTQMLFERAIADDGFEGTFSDFINWAPAKYFEDRGWSLGWNKRTTHPMR